MRIAMIKPPPRYGILPGIVLFFLAINLLARIGLIFFSGEWTNLNITRLIEITGVGLVYDLAAVSYVLTPFALINLLLPNSKRGNKVHAALCSLLLMAAIYIALFTSIASFLFWNEFSARFNFIAVDYLIYTREALGNIKQSYPVSEILAAIAFVGGGIFWFLSKKIWLTAASSGGSFKQRLASTVILLALPVFSFTVVDDSPRLSIYSASGRELAGNDYYDFMRAFRNNDLDYPTFYSVVLGEQAESSTYEEFIEAKSNAIFKNPHSIMSRLYRLNSGTVSKPNLVLVSMESMGAEFIKSLGGEEGLTPNLDQLAQSSLVFENTYATGLRTVRGLEAITLSLPPLPGHAIPVRKNNKGLQTLGGVLKQNGYETMYIYGGYSQFDNMKDFFSGNGYTVIDRTDIPSKKISHETIWGVADEDLFGQALIEIESRVNSGKPVFAHIMTTSNHRPYTYPSGRISIPSGSGRNGAVKYADWAIGDFLRKAAQRPWFDKTIFVFVADHTSKGRGKIDLDPEHFHIPYIVYSPKIIAPERIASVASQIDVAPTLLKIMGISYQSNFMGQDITSEGHYHQRAFMANYLTVGYMENGKLVELMPNRNLRVIDLMAGKEIDSKDPQASEIINEAISHYQFASNWVSHPKEAQVAIH